MAVNCWNVQSIANKFFEVEGILHSADVTIGFLSETWCKARHMPLHFPGYRCISNLACGTNRGVGLAAVIRKDLQAYPYQLTTRISSAYGCRDYRMSPTLSSDPFT